MQVGDAGPVHSPALQRQNLIWIHDTYNVNTEHPLSCVQRKHPLSQPGCGYGVLSGVLGGYNRMCMPQPNRSCPAMVFKFAP